MLFRSIGPQQVDFLVSMTSSGGNVTMDYDADGRPPPRLPLWLRGMCGEWPYARVQKVKVGNVDQLKTVGEFPQLRELDCSVLR